MDLRHLAAFVAVAEEGSFTKAALRLHISQPPLSRQVRQLEDELGFPLFVRGRVGIELTPQGRGLLETARSANLAVAAFEEAAKQAKDPRARGVTLGVAWGLWPAVDLIRVHHSARYPDVRIGLEDICAIHGSVKEREVDVVVGRPPIDRDQYESSVLFHECMSAIISDTHPLARRESITLRDLAHETLLLFDRSIGPAVYDKVLALYKAAAVHPRVVAGQPPPFAQRAMMLVASRQGFYVGISSRFTQSHCVSGVAVVPLDEPDARSEVRIAWRRGEQSQNVKDFLRSAREVFPPAEQPAAPTALRAVAAAGRRAHRASGQRG